jgi:diguanylate cyclase (GGDEF)-like protein
MGGDEFVVLLPHIETDHDAERVAERIRTALARPFLIDTHTLLISASIGIGIFPDDGNDHESLIKSADDAMYRAKDSGRDQLIFASGP